MNPRKKTTRTTTRNAKQKTSHKTLQLALSSMVAAGLSAAAFDAEAAKPKWEGHEKCYGVARKGMNDCGNAHHQCGGMSTADGAGDEWIYVPEGTCEKLAGGSTEPKMK